MATINTMKGAAQVTRNAVRKSFKYEKYENRAIGMNVRRLKFHTPGVELSVDVYNEIHFNIRYALELSATRASTSMKRVKGYDKTTDSVTWYDAIYVTLWQD